MLRLVQELSDDSVMGLLAGGELLRISGVLCHPSYSRATHVLGSESLLSLFGIEPSYR